MNRQVLIFGLGIITALCYYVLFVIPKPVDDLSRLQSFINSLPDHSIDILKAYKNDESDELDLANFIGFVAEKSDESIFWNNKGIEGSDKEIYINHEALLDGYQVRSGLLLFDENQKISASLNNFLNLEYRFGQTRESELELSYTGSENAYPMEVLSYYPAPWKILLFLILITATLIGILLLMTRYILNVKEPRKYAIFTVTGIAVLILIRGGVGSLISLSALSDATFFSTRNFISTYNPSIGLLGLNILLFTTIAYWIYRWPTSENSHLKRFKTLQVMGVLAVTGLFLLLFFIIRGITFNTGVNLNIERILTLDKYSLEVIFMIYLSMLSIFLITTRLTSIINTSNSPKYRIAIYGTGIILSVAFMMWLNVGMSIIPPIIFLIAYYILFDLFQESSRQSIVWAIWWIMIYSGFLAAILFTYSQQKHLQTRQASIKNIYRLQDQSLDEKIVKIADGLSEEEDYKVWELLQQGRIDREDLKSIYKNSLLEASVDSEIKDFNIDLYDSTSLSLIKYDYGTIYTYNEKLRQSKKITNRISYDPFEKEYILYHLLRDKNGIPSRLSLFIRLKVENVPPHQTDYLNYSVYEGENLIKEGPFLNKAVPTAPYKSLEVGTYTLNGTSIIVHQASEDIRIINAESIARLVKPISLFSFLFFIFGLLTIILAVCNERFDLGLDDLSLRVENLASLRGRIQMAIVLLIIFSFFLIGLVTAFYFNNVLGETQEKQIIDNLNAVKEDIALRLLDASNAETALAILNNSLPSISKIHDGNFSLYNSKGTLISTHDLTSPGKLDYSTYQSLTLNSEKKLRTSNSPNTSVIPLRLLTTGTYGFVKYESKKPQVIKSKIIEFISTILNVYVFLFLLAGALSLSIATSITRPLEVLAEKIKSISLSKKNEYLEWNSNDEIGALISDYNRMISKLEESALTLAKTERDLAWREMAKQVAHEIKNPLTPMKLSIQYLQRAIESQPEKAQEMIEKVSSTLIEQIDGLSQIASEFSNFAKMPQAFNEKVIFNEVVETVHDLFRKREDMDIKLIEPIDEIYVFADRNQLIRVLNNLIKNAIQSIPETRRGEVTISLDKNKSNAFVKVRDNGRGIPNEMCDRVFSPNFTTKNSGTGLGLAISANIIDSFNGSIYFESEENLGTEFVVELPLMRLEENYDNKNRVVLD